MSDLNEKYALETLTEFNKNELNDGVPEEELKRIAKHAPTWCAQVEKDEKLSIEVVEQILLLALYDVVLLLDDSGSMRREEYPLRIEQMKQVAQKIIRVNSIFLEADPQIAGRGIFVKFLNNNTERRVYTVSEFDRDFDQVRYGGWTRLGSTLRTKILDPLVRSTDKNIRKARPLLISIITDGKPEGEDVNQLKNELVSCKNFVNQTPELGRRAVVFQISQVGNSEAIKAFLHRLEGDEVLKNVIDVTSNSELEAKRKGSPLVEEQRTIKMLAGALLVDFDQYHNEKWDA